MADHAAAARKAEIRPPAQRAAADARFEHAAPIRALESTAQTLNARPMPVVQAKLIRGKKTITPWFWQTPSPVAKRYIDAHETYVLRDDSDILASPIHVLPADGKYLLGEVHGDGTWAARTAQWSSIPKLHEARKAIPEAEPGDMPGGLESMHAYAMQAAINAQTMLHPLHVAWTHAQAHRQQVPVPQLPQHFDLMLGQGLTWVRELKTAGNQYRAFAQKYAPRNNEAPIAAVRLFSTTFETTYRPELVQMDTDITALRNMGAQALAAGAQPEQDRIYASRAILENIVTDLLALQVAPPNADVGRIQTLSQRAAPNAQMPMDYLAVGNPHREAAMITKVNAAPAPVMVQLGNNHVDPVAAGVAGAVKVKIGVNLNAATEKSN